MHLHCTFCAFQKVIAMKKTYRLNRALRFLTGRRRPHTVAILLAGGSGSRMQSKDGTTKQLMQICGLPVLVHTARAFDACPYIDEIIIVARREEIHTVEGLARTYGIRKFRCAVAGRDTRQLSALAGFEAIDGKKTKFVAIHDVARCTVTPDMIADVVAAAHATGAAAAASRVVDTVKRADASGYVTETLDREALWLAATPQVFSEALYRAAAYTAVKAGFTATDDMMLCERIGQRVKLIDCGSENFKITTPPDILRAEAILRSREEGSK